MVHADKLVDRIVRSSSPVCNPILSSVLRWRLLFGLGWRVGLRNPDGHVPELRDAVHRPNRAIILV